MPLYHVLSPSEYTLAPSPRVMISTVKGKTVANCGNSALCRQECVSRTTTCIEENEEIEMNESNWRIGWTMKWRTEWIDELSRRLVYLPSHALALLSLQVRSRIRAFFLSASISTLIISCPEPALLSLNFQRCRKPRPHFNFFFCTNSPCLSIQRWPCSI